MSVLREKHSEVWLHKTAGEGGSGSGNTPAESDPEGAGGVAAPAPPATPVPRGVTP